MNKLIMSAFIVMVLAQWWIPGNMIREKQQVLAKGSAYKFLTEPVDPSHPFKGKYIALSFRADSYTLDSKHEYLSGEPVYVLLSKDDSGFARIAGLSHTKPANQVDYVKASVSFTSSEDKQTIHIQWPFEEFYMDEYKAPQAERIYRESNVNGKNNTYALVRVYKGDAVVDDVFINDVPLQKLINR